jgi:hypothetical protein
VRSIGIVVCAAVAIFDLSRREIAGRLTSEVSMSTDVINEDRVLERKPELRLRSKPLRVAYTVARVLLGLLLVVNSPVGTLIPSPPSGAAGDALLAALWGSPWIMVLAKLVELCAGVLLVSNRFVPLALTVFAPVLVNIVAFQASFSPQVLPLGLGLLTMTLFLAWENRAAYSELLRAKPARA